MPRNANQRLINAQIIDKTKACFCKILDHLQLMTLL